MDQWWAWPAAGLATGAAKGVAKNAVDAISAAGAAGAFGVSRLTWAILALALASKAALRASAKRFFCMVNLKE